MYSKKAFTLVELIVWITISMLLMVSIWVLVSSWMQNILKQQKIMDKNSLLSETVSDFYNGFENISSSWWHIYSYESWAIFKIDQSINKWWFAYLGLTSQPNLYCSDDSELPLLHYLTWKSFIPYEEVWEDIFRDFSDIEAQTVTSWSTYLVDTLNHQVLQDDVRIIGWDVFGHEINHWESWLETRLNNPTWIALAEWGFFLSDTLNDRILFYKDGNIYLILDQNDWLVEPTWLAYDNTKNILYIANSWKWEILKLSSEVLLNNPSLVINFSPINNVQDITRIKVIFPSLWWNLNSMTWSDFNFSNINNWNWYINTVNNTIEYYFTDYLNSRNWSPTNWNINNCSSQPSPTYALNWNTPERTEITCYDTHTGSRVIYSRNIENDFSNNQSYTIEIDNISPAISTAGNHLIELELYDLIWATPQFSDTFSYFVQWDWILNNLESTTLSSLISGLWYPTGLNLTGGNRLEINDFITRKQYSYNLNNISSFSTNNLFDFSDSNLESIPHNSNIDTLLNNPVSKIEIQYDSANKFLTNIINYYQYINCYNPEEKVEKTFVLQKNID